MQLEASGAHSSLQESLLVSFSAQVLRVAAKKLLRKHFVFIVIDFP
jgi:hypothetical protein